jgi:hypothetical protein
VNRITLQRLALALADHTTPRLPVELQHGPEGTLLVAGTARWCRYLPDRFFGGPAPHRRLLGYVPVWCLPKVLESWLPRVDLAIARVTVLAMGHFPAGRQLHVPEWVRTVARVPRSARFPAATRRGRTQRLILKQGLSWRCSHDPRDLATFITRDYRPYILQRYGQDAHLRSERWMRQRLRHGALLWIEQDNQPLAAALVNQQGPTLHYLAAACCHGDPSHLGTGAMGATYLASFELARELGCTHVDLRNSRPSPADGLLSQKLSWGGVITSADDLTHDLLLSWERASPSLLRFLASTPLFFRQGDALACLDADPANAQTTKAAASAALPGITDHCLLRLGDGVPPWQPQTGTP